ncbi:MAG TPA: GNAT family N-acetyltransferase [Aquella sp.]|nr:GNAT family N-acetyltransferase [Aquella sp.]
MNINDLIFRWVTYGDPDYLALVQLRREVLRYPLNLDYTEEDLKKDACYYHIGAFTKDTNTAVGNIILTDITNDTCRIRQLAVRSDLQHSGIGKTLMYVVETHAKIVEEVSTIFLHSRESAVPFYKKLGYNIEGDSFEEVGLVHYKMVKKL